MALWAYLSYKPIPNTSENSGIKGTSKQNGNETMIINGVDWSDNLGGKEGLRNSVITNISMMLGEKIDDEIRSLVYPREKEIENLVKQLQREDRDEDDDFDRGVAESELKALIRARALWCKAKRANLLVSLNRFSTPVQAAMSMAAETEEEKKARSDALWKIRKDLLAKRRVIFYTLSYYFVWQEEEDRYDFNAARWGPGTYRPRILLALYEYLALIQDGQELTARDLRKQYKNDDEYIRDRHVKFFTEGVQRLNNENDAILRHFGRLFKDEAESWIKATDCRDLRLRTQEVSEYRKLFDEQRKTKISRRKDYREELEVVGQRLAALGELCNHHWLDTMRKRCEFPRGRDLLSENSKDLHCKYVTSLGFWGETHQEIRQRIPLEVRQYLAALFRDAYAFMLEEGSSSSAEVRAPTVVPASSAAAVPASSSSSSASAAVRAPAVVPVSSSAASSASSASSVSSAASFESAKEQERRDAIRDRAVVLFGRGDGWYDPTTAELEAAERDLASVPESSSAEVRAPAVVSVPVSVAAEPASSSSSSVSAAAVPAVPESSSVSAAAAVPAVPESSSAESSAVASAPLTLKQKKRLRKAESKRASELASTAASVAEPALEQVSVSAPVVASAAQSLSWAEDAEMVEASAPVTASAPVASAPVAPVPPTPSSAVVDQRTFVEVTRVGLPERVANQPAAVPESVSVPAPAPVSASVSVPASLSWNEKKIRRAIEHKRALELASAAASVEGSERATGESQDAPKDLTETFSGLSL